MRTGLPYGALAFRAEASQKTPSQYCIRLKHFRAFAGANAYGESSEPT